MPSQSTSAPADNLKVKRPSASRFVARQPVLKADEKVFGYELLFRDGVENQFNGVDPEHAPRSVLDSSLLMGLDLLCDGRHAFINCTRERAAERIHDLAAARASHRRNTRNHRGGRIGDGACKKLKNAGYLLALDDFIEDDPRAALASLADIIKVDFRLTPPRHLAGIVERYGRRSMMLAEKIETQIEFRAAKKLGFVYFQGYFFCKPEMLPNKDL